MEGEVQVKNESTEDDYTYVYEGAPSPEAPVYELIPLQNTPPNKQADPVEQYTFEETDSMGDYSNYFFNMEELEKQYTCFKKMMLDYRKDVPSMSSYMPDTKTQDKATQCADGYVNPNFVIKSVRDASTETCATQGFYYENGWGMCTCNKPVEHPSEVGTSRDVQRHKRTILTDFSLSQDASMEN